jgi:hypothetical protein
VNNALELRVQRILAEAGILDRMRTKLANMRQRQPAQQPVLPPNTAQYQRTKYDPNATPTSASAPDDPWGPAQPIPQPPSNAKTTGFKNPRSIDTMAIPDFLKRQQNAPVEYPEATKPLSHKTVDQVLAALAPMLLASGTATVR